MRALTGAAVLILAAGALADTPAESKPKDGYWKPDAVVFEGSSQLNPADKDSLLLVTAHGEHRLYVMTDPKAGKGTRVYTAEFRPDPATRAFEMVVTDGVKKGTKVHGIYEVTGTSFKLCYGPADKPRPTKLEATAGSGLFYESWTYLNPQPKPAN